MPLPHQSHFRLCAPITHPPVRHVDPSGRPILPWAGTAGRGSEGGPWIKG
ncbi:hypothetical protein GCM10023237_46180 [Streptomyces coeruleoprunus]